MLHHFLKFWTLCSEIFETLFAQLLSRRAALARCKGVVGGECGDQPAISQFRVKILNTASEYHKHQQFSGSKILPKLHLQNLAWTSTSKSWPKCSKLRFITKPQLPNLHQTVANTILITNTSNSNNLEFGVGIFTRQFTSVKFTKQESVSQSVSQLLTSIANDRTRVR